MTLELPSNELPPSKDKALNSKDIKRIARALHRILRDVEGTSSLIERFDEITKLLYCKVHDERGGNVVFKIRKGDTESSVSCRLGKAFRDHVKRNKHLFPKRFSKILLSKVAAYKLVETLAPIELARAEEDIKGLVFEEVIRNTFEKGDNQQFFTPRLIVEFIVQLLAEVLSGTMMICDPACGTGGFLLYAASALRSKNSGKEMTLLGLEIDERLSWAAGINLHMFNVRGFEIRHLKNSGSLGPGLEPLMGTIDGIITNPPFGSDLADQQALAGFELGAGKPSRRRGVLFVERCLSLLKPGGVVGMIIDDGVLNSPTNTDTRRLILEQAEPFAIISLPDTAFMPYATVKASILFLQKRGGRKKRLHRGGRTFFAWADVVGRKPNGDPLYRVNPVTRKLELDSDLPTILAQWQKTDGEETELREHAFYSRVPSIDDSELEANGFRLDLAYHHPSRSAAMMALQESPYKIRPLVEICNIRTEAVIPAKEMPDEEITYIGLANIEAISGNFSPVVTSGATVKSVVHRFTGGDILYAKLRPELRKICFVGEEIDEGFVSSECLVLIPKTNEQTGKPIFLPELLALLLRTDLVYGQVVHQVTGIGRPRLNKTNVLRVLIPVPPIEEQKRLIDSYRRSEETARTLAEESKRGLNKAKQIVEDAKASLVQDLLTTSLPVEKAMGVR